MKILLFSVLVTLSSFAYASTEPLDTGKSLYIDQDLLGADFAIQKNDDRDYTMGVEYSFAGARVEETPVYSTLSGWLDSLSSSIRFRPSEHDYFRLSHAGSVGNTAFTPNDLTIAAPIQGDRPYANLLYISAAETFIYDPDSRPRPEAGTNELVIGILGLDIGKVVQTKIHEWTDSNRPVGWDNQISEGGELTALYSHNRIYLLNSIGDS